jgi:hypothetical protein
MQDVLIGVLAIFVGALLCFYGYTAFRVVISVWGAFAGFFLGAGLVAGVTGDTFLATALAWAVGITVGLVFGALAYAYYVASVALGMGAIGFALGTTAMVALGVRWSWVVVLVGVGAAVLLAMLAVIGDLPLLIVALLSALAGASTIITGVLLVTGVIDRAALTATTTTQSLALGWWWSAGYVVLAVVGMVGQLRTEQARRGTLRQAWAA